MGFVFNEDHPINMFDRIKSDIKERLTKTKKENKKSNKKENKDDTGMQSSED